MEKKIILVEQNLTRRGKIEAMICAEEGLVMAGSYESTSNLLKSIHKQPPHLIIISLDDNPMEISTASEITKNKPEIKIMFISSNVNEEFLSSALSTGANSICSSDSSYQEILSAIHITLRGEYYLCSTVTKSLVKSYHSNPYSPLSRKESEVANYIDCGYSYTEIADILGVSKETIKSHLKNIYKKIEVRKKSELVYKLRKNKLIRTHYS